MRCNLGVELLCCPRFEALLPNVRRQLSLRARTKYSEVKGDPHGRRSFGTVDCRVLLWADSAAGLRPAGASCFGRLETLYRV